MPEEGTSRPSAPEPPSYSDWFDVKKKAALLKNLLFAEDDLRRKLSPVEKVEALQDAVARGKHARRLLDSPFWADDVEPFLKAQSALKPYNPPGDGLFSLFRLVFEYVFGSGQARMAVKFVERLHAWDKDGAAAEKFLLAEADRRRRADEARAQAEAARK